METNFEFVRQVVRLVRQSASWRSRSIALLAVLMSASPSLTPALAQDALEPVIRPCRGLSSSRQDVSANSRQDRQTRTHILDVYEQEWQRLLVPQASAFGMICRPSFAREYALTFDSIGRRLVCIEADTSIWSCVYRARHDRSMYQAPRVQTYELSVPDSLSVKLRKLWTAAVTGAQRRDRKVMMLDGTTWDFFIGERMARTHGAGERVGKLLQFVTRLAQAVRQTAQPPRPEGEPADLNALTPELDELLERFTQVSAEMN